MPTIKQVIDKVFELSAHDIKWFTPAICGQAFAATEKRPFHKCTMSIPQDIPFQELVFGDQRLLVLAIPDELMDKALAQLSDEKNDQPVQQPADKPTEVK